MNSTKPTSDFLSHQASTDANSNILSAYNTNHYLGSNPMNYNQVDSQTTFGSTPYPRLPLTSRPRLTTTLWKDEGTVCYQIDIRGICVARRQDNDMINGTKLLNVTGMSRGKRDGILKNEKGRVVIKAGAMHLKGVWITFERAKTLATQFNVEDVLYPLFVEDPTIFLYSSMHYPLNRISHDQTNSWSSFQSSPQIETGFHAITPTNSNTTLSHLNYEEKTVKPQTPENSIFYENFMGESAKQDSLSFYSKIQPVKSSAFHPPYSRSVEDFSRRRESNIQSLNQRYHPYKHNSNIYKQDKNEFNKHPW
ncbi:hypothetical protein G6F56_009672 [Rhizopus delemar]|nr:hypothetical protein G6F56_009672 [Rhizopus delemar]